MTLERELEIHNEEHETLRVWRYRQGRDRTCGSCGQEIACCQLSLVIGHLFEMSEVICSKVVERYIFTNDERQMTNDD